MTLPATLPDAAAQAAITRCRQAMTAAKVVYEEMLLAKEDYERLGLGAVEDSDFSDGLAAATFTMTVGNFDSLLDAYSAGIRTNLGTAGL